MECIYLGLVEVYPTNSYDIFMIIYLLFHHNLEFRPINGSKYLRPKMKTKSKYMMVIVKLSYLAMAQNSMLSSKKRQSIYYKCILFENSFFFKKGGG